MSAPAPKTAPRLAVRSLPFESFLLPHVTLFDPSLELDAQGDLLVMDGVIEALGEGVQAPPGIAVLAELEGCHVFPAFVDPHTHLRVPGFDYKEDLESGTTAAAAGGYGVVVGMANTDPVVDEGPVAAWVLDEAVEKAHVYVGQVGAVTKGLAGESLAELRELCTAGVCAFSDDGRPLVQADLLLSALRYLRGTGRPLLLHLEDLSLSRGAVMHEGKWSARLGLRGIPIAAETGPLSRDLEIVEYAFHEGVRMMGGATSAGSAPSAAGSLVHFQHLSAAASVDLVANAKKAGLPVTAEVTPHHLLLTDEEVKSFDQSLKVNPPLRSEVDRRRLVEALNDGTIDCIGTDHAPHAPHEKEVPFEEASHGTVGLETAFAALYDGLVKTGEVGLGRLIEAMSAAPCHCLGLEAPRLEKGAPANFCVAELGASWTLGRGDLRGKSRNSAFLGRKMRGRVVLTVVAGVRRYTFNPAASGNAALHAGLEGGLHA